MEINNFRKQLREILLEGLVEEKYLDKLTSKILKYVAEELFKKEKYKIFTNDKQDMFIMMESIFEINSNKIDVSDFPKILQEWIDNRGGIEIVFTTDNSGSVDNTSRQGSYAGWNSIRLMYSSNETFKETWELLNDKHISKIENDAIYLSIKLYYLFHQTLLHELRHAFDDYRTKGKYLSTKRWNKFTNKVVQYNRISKEDRTDQQASNIYSSYLKLPHEIDARYTQALHNLRFSRFVKGKEFDFENDNREKVAFNEVFRDFKYKFENWESLTKSMQQRILKRLYKAWMEYDVDKSY